MAACVCRCSFINANFNNRHYGSWQPAQVDGRAVGFFLPSPEGQSAALTTYEEWAPIRASSGPRPRAS